jgi:hypothetical protein
MAANVQPRASIMELVNPSVSRWLVLLGALALIILRFGLPTKDASVIIIRQIQGCLFSEEWHSLSNGKSVDANSKISSLNPFMDMQGIIRLGGRLGRNNDLTYVEKHPAILTRCGSVELLVLHIHEISCHAGPAIVLVELRRRGYWLLRGRKTVAAILQGCRKCRRYQAASFSPSEPPFPGDRVRFTRLFGVTGVDLLGPLPLKTGEKVWIAILTCF